MHAALGASAVRLFRKGLYFSNGISPTWGISQPDMGALQLLGPEELGALVSALRHALDARRWPRLQLTAKLLENAVEGAAPMPARPGGLPSLYAGPSLCDCTRAYVTQ